MRRAPYTGSVSKLSGKRRKPWYACVTLGWEVRDGKAVQIRKSLGTYKTKKEAQEALEKFNVDPYDLTKAGITFREVYELWSEEHFKTQGATAIRTWKSAFNHSSPLHDMPFREIKTIHLEKTIENAEVGTPTKQRMKSMYNLIYRYALKHEICDKDYAALFSRPKSDDKPAKHKAFTDEQIRTLWEHKDDPYINMVLIGIYTGMRPGELCTLPPEAVFDDHIIWGSKTEAGRDRTIPLHSAISEEILALRQKTARIGSHEVSRTIWGVMTYDIYRRKFEKIRKAFGWDNSPHDTRHTFITLAKRYGVSEGALKVMVGHKAGDVTEDTYTHRTIEDLKREIEKIKAPEH